MQKLYDIFEVQKTISFELVPFSHSSAYQPKHLWARGYHIMPEKFFSETLLILPQIEEVLSKFKNEQFSDIFVEKIFFKELDSEIFYSLSKEKIFSSENLIEKIFKNKKFPQSLKDKFYKRINDCILQIDEIRHDFDFYNGEIIRITKADKIRIMKKSAYKLKNIIAFINFFQTRNQQSYLQKWKSFCQTESGQDFIHTLHGVCLSLKQNSAIEWMRAGLNAKSLTKKVDLDGIKNEIKKLQQEKDEIERKKVFYTERISLWNEQYSQEISNERQKIEKNERNKTRINKKIEEWRKWKSDYFVTEWDKNKSLGDWKKYYSQKYGEIKQKIFSKEQEVLNQESLWYYAVLLRRNNRYYLMLSDKNIKRLPKLSTSESAEFLVFNSLTFKALYKLLQTNTNDRFLKELLLKPSQKRNEHEDKQILDELKKALLKFGAEYEITPDEFKHINTIDEFRIFVTEKCYKRQWQKCSWEDIIEAELKGEILLFQIYNKDMPLPESKIKELQQKLWSQYIEKPIKQRERENLFTQYWRECLEDNLSHIHMSPEIKIFYRIKKNEDELMKKIHKPDELGSFRYREDKIIAEFRMNFYPAKKSTARNIQDKIQDEFANKEVSFIGIDRWENSLANYMVLDKNGNIKQDEFGNFLKWDMSVVTVDGRFIDIENCVLGNGENCISLEIYIDGEAQKRQDFTLNRFRRIHELIGAEFHNFLTIIDGRISPNWSNLSLEDLIKIEEYLEKNIHPQILRYQEKNTGILAFDYAYAFSWMRMLIKVRYEKQVKIAQDKNLSEDNKRRIFTHLLDTISIKSGFVGYIVKALSDMATKYNSYIVFESLNIQYDMKKNNDDFLSGISFEKLTPKQQNQLKGLSVYHLIEQKLLNKLNYLHWRNKKWLQTTPKINNLWLLRYYTDENGKMLSQKTQKEKDIFDVDLLGNIVYISEENTSKECPKCKNKLYRNKVFKDKKYYYDQCCHNEDNPGKDGCSFDTKTHPYIKTGDELAAYNIALRGIKKIQQINFKQSISNEKLNKNHKMKWGRPMNGDDNDNPVITYNPFKNLFNN